MRTVYVIGSGKSAIELDRYRNAITDSVGCNYSYRLIVSQAHVFTDWMMWVGKHEDLTSMDTEMYCIRTFNTEIANRTPGPKVPDRFHRFQCYFWEGLSNSDDRLTTGWTSLIPAINLAYLKKPDVIALIGVELDNTEHFWNCPEWPEVNRRQMKLHDWKGPIFEYENPPESGFPHQADVLKQMHAIGDWLRRAGIRPVNCSAGGSVTGWDRVSLEEMTCSDSSICSRT